MRDVCFFLVPIRGSSSLELEGALNNIVAQDDRFRDVVPFHLLEKDIKSLIVIRPRLISILMRENFGWGIFNFYIVLWLRLPAFVGERLL